MTNDRVHIGPYEIVRFFDGVFQAPVDAMTHAGGEAVRREIVAAWEKPAIALDVNCYLLRHEAGIGLVDAGGGPALGPGFGQARPAMIAAGVAPEDVRFVLLTHLHTDHAFGLFENGAPYFPNAEILVPDADLAFFTDPAAQDATPEARRGGFRVAERLRTVYGARLRACPEGSVLPGVEAKRLPGHTPGHSGYLLRGENDGLFLWGDVLHLETLQPGDPDIGMIYDLAPSVAAATRKSALDDATRNGWIVAGGHMGFNRVSRGPEGGYRFAPL